MTVGLHLTCANALANVFRHVSYDIPATFVQLHTGDPGEDGEDNISGADPSLKAVSFSAAANGGIELSASPIWTNDDLSETLTHISVWDGPDGPGTDEILFSVVLTVSQAWQDHDTYTLDELGLAFVPIMAD